MAIYKYKLVLRDVVTGNELLSTASQDTPWLLADTLSRLQVALGEMLAAAGVGPDGASVAAALTRKLSASPRVCVTAMYKGARVRVELDTLSSAAEARAVAGWHASFELYAMTQAGTAVDRLLIARAQQPGLYPPDGDTSYPVVVTGLLEAMTLGTQWCQSALKQYYDSMGAQQAPAVMGLSMDVTAKKLAVLRVLMSRRRTAGNPGRGESSIVFRAGLPSKSGMTVDQYVLVVRVINAEAPDYATAAVGVA